MADATPQTPEPAATQPIDVAKILSDLHTDFADVVDVATGDGTSAPEPAVVRGLILSVVSIAGYALGKSFNVEWVDEAMSVYAVLAPVGLAFWVRRHVTPAPK